MKTLYFILICFFLCGAALAAGPYYIDTTCTNNGDGLGPECAAAPAAVGAFNSGATINGYSGAGYNGADVYIYGGTTVTGSMRSWWSGSAGDVAEITSYNKGFMGLAKPIFDGVDTAVYGIDTTGGAYNNSYRYVHHLAFTRHTTQASLQMGAFNSPTLCDNCRAEYNDFYNCGERCFIGGGDNFKLIGNTCTNAHTEGTGSDVACLTLDGGNAGDEVTGHTITGAEVSYNTSYDNPNGSCYEFNFGVTNSTIHHNTGTNCANQCMELYSGGDDNRLYANYCNSMGYADRVAESAGMKFATGSDGNLVYNNKVIGAKAVGLWTGYSVETLENKNNKFFNDTIVSDETNFIGFGNSNGSPNDTGNEWKNILVRAPNGRAFQITAADNILNYNDYSVGSTLGVYLGTTYTLANMAVYQAATGQDANSITSDPNIDYTLYAPQQGSPTINAGTNLSTYFTDDYYGNPRLGAWDIGAVEFTEGTREYINVGFSGVEVR